MDALAFDKALEQIWSLNGEMNRYIDTTKPWTLAKTDVEAAKQILTELIFTLRRVATYIAPFMPKTAEEMHTRLAPGPIGKYAPLFPRLEK